jgi:23S rRNA A1618 N6-methylase RlmF
LLAFFGSVTSAAPDEARLRSSLVALDYDAVVRDFEATPSPSVPERALYVHALARLQALGRATTESDKLRAQHAGDAWT